jgi:hypothetical protein
VDDEQPAPAGDGVAEFSRHRVRQTLSGVSVILGICSPVASFIIPSTIGFERFGPSLRLIAFAPAFMMLAGLALAIAARRRGERGRLASTALSWNTLLLIVYAVMLVALLGNPFSAT